MKALLATLALALLACTASADNTFIYTGNIFNYGKFWFNPGPGKTLPPDQLGPNPCNCALDGSLTLNATFEATAWNFTDGTNVWNNTNSTGIISTFNDIGGPSFDVGRDPASPFRLWFIDLTNTSGVTMLTKFTSGSMLDAADTAPNLTVFGDPGIWTAVAEPGTLGLVGLGLAGLLLRKRKKARVPGVWEPLA